MNGFWLTKIDLITQEEVSKAQIRLKGKRHTATSKVVIINAEYKYYPQGLMKLLEKNS